MAECNIDSILNLSIKLVLFKTGDRIMREDTFREKGQEQRPYPQKEKKNLVESKRQSVVICTPESRPHQSDRHT
jgi:hypothetical protein